jgi:hypothetical protein
VTVFATGFNAPRGLAFSPRGQLYVAEAGSGGTDTTVDLCPDLQLPAPAGGPTMNGPTARISRVSRSGVRSTVVDGLPSVVTTFGGDPIGVADVTFIGGKLYALVAGGGCSNGNRDPKRPNGVIRVRRDGSWRYVVNLSSYYMSHPIADPPDDFTPDGVPYDMVRQGRHLDIVEANSGVIDRVPVGGGSIRRIVDISKTQGHSVPTAVARHRGDLYVGTLGQFPIQPGTQAVYRVHRGHLQKVASGLTAIVSIAFDTRHRLYVLETSAVGPFPKAAKGRIVRVDQYGNRTVVADGLTYPTAMTFGPDGDLYVSVNGYNLADGAGEILRVHFPTS